LTERRVIKKYANRRLYDTDASKHVTLADIRKLIISGVDIRVLEETTGNDITRAMLLQIIVDQEQSDTPLLPEMLLAQLIRFYGNPMQGMMGDYLQQSVGTFVAQQESMQSQMQNMLTDTPMDTLQALMKKNMSAWESMMGSSAATDDKKKSE